jgi:hypothetical protein
MANIFADQVNTNKKVIYEIAVRNEYHVPPCKSAFCTLKYLGDVL